MKKYIKRILKGICAAFLILYGFNAILSTLNILVPINIFNLSVVSILGIPGYLSLLMMYFITK